MLLFLLRSGLCPLLQWNFVMHPVYAAKAADPEGDYVRRWCPELAKLPLQFIHCPWDAPATTLAAAGE